MMGNACFVVWLADLLLPTRMLFPSSHELLQMLAIFLPSKLSFPFSSRKLFVGAARSPDAGHAEVGRSIEIDTMNKATHFGALLDM